MAGEEDLGDYRAVLAMGIMMMNMTRMEWIMMIMVMITYSRVIACS